VGGRGYWKSNIRFVWGCVYTRDVLERLQGRKERLPKAQFKDSRHSGWPLETFGWELYCNDLVLVTSYPPGCSFCVALPCAGSVRRGIVAVIGSTDKFEVYRIKTETTPLEVCPPEYRQEADNLIHLRHGSEDGTG
jgi:hypothetical protein